MEKSLAYPPLQGPLSILAQKELELTLKFHET
jgi:hypothetical protein